MGSGRRAAINHAFKDVSDPRNSLPERTKSPGGKIKPTAKNSTWAVLLFGAFALACSLKLGAWKIVRRPPRDALLCHRCGDQLGDTLRGEGPRISAKSSPAGRTRRVAKGLCRRWSLVVLARVRGRNIFNEMFSVEVEGRLSGRSFTVEAADRGRE